MTMRLTFKFWTFLDDISPINQFYRHSICKSVLRYTVGCKTVFACYRTSVQLYEN